MTKVDPLPPMRTAFNEGRFESVLQIFKTHFGDTHRIPEACFLVGLALNRSKKFALAIQYLHHAQLGENGLNVNALLALIEAYEGAGDARSMLQYANLLYDIVPNNATVFGKLQHARITSGLPKLQRWMVIGDSHSRYFRFMQINKNVFFQNRLFLDILEIAGASAFGLGNENSQSGALALVEKVKDRIALADGVIVNFGEIDCRRAAWKAAHDLGRPIEDCLNVSAQHLATFVKTRVFPFNRNVVVLGAKPQIIGDEDHYRNSLEDDRVIFQPLEIRQEKTLFFNNRVSQHVQQIGADYFSIDYLLEDEQLTAEFQRNCFWDEYSTDTHGNTPYFAQLYFHLLKERLSRGN